MNTETLNILADAISDVGSWHRWRVRDDTVQIQFCDIQLYDASKPEKDTHTTDVIAVRFCGHAFAVFLDNLDVQNWHTHFLEDDSVIYPVDTYELAFDDIGEAEAVLRDYRNKTPVKDWDGLQKLTGAKHLLYARCGEVGLVAGGDEIMIIGKKGPYTEEEIKADSGKWWDYWKDYWKRRGTKEAYPYDYACEITIPVKAD